MGEPLPGGMERLFDTIAHDLGWNDHSMQRDRPYNGQAHTSTGARGSQEVRGLTMRDLRDCFIRAYVMSHPYYKDGTIERLEPNATLIDEAKRGPDAVLCENDVYGLVGGVDAMAVSQNLGCEIERTMGIFPNMAAITGAHQ